VANKIASVEAEMILPVKMVYNGGVAGRSLNRRAFPTRVPMRSPTVAITPPRIKTAIRMNDAVVISSYQNPPDTA